MRLNASSMSKLFDLMLMSLKLQLLRIKFPEEIYQITMNHLNELVEILVKSNYKGNEDILKLVYENIDYTKQVSNLHEI
jgi:hypothetical protein